MQLQPHAMEHAEAATAGGMVAAWTQPAQQGVMRGPQLAVPVQLVVELQLPDGGWVKMCERQRPQPAGLRPSPGEAAESSMARSRLDMSCMVNGVLMRR